MQSRCIFARIFAALLTFGLAAQSIANDYIVRQVSDVAFNGGTTGLRIEAPQLLGERLIFASESASGTELFATDGYSVSEYDIQPGPNPSHPTWFHQWRDRLFFMARGPSGGELYSIADSGPALAADISPNPDGSWPGSHTGFIELNDRLYFFAGLSDELALYSTSGVGADFVAAVDFDSFFHHFRANDRIVFAGTGPAGVELYQTDGIQTSLLADINPGPRDSNPFPPLEHDGYFYFSATGPHGNELFRTDGNSVTEFDVAPGAASSSPIPRRTFKGELYFGADRGNGRELFKTDGEKIIEFDMYPGPNGSGAMDSYSAIVGDSMFFVANGPNGRELFYTDGKSVDEIDIAVGPASSDPLFFKTVGEALYLRADGPAGVELYRVQGGTVDLLDLNPGIAGSHPQTSASIEFDGALYMSANGPNGVELFRVDGTKWTTFDIFNGAAGSYPRAFTEFDGQLFFTAVDANGRSIFRTDGTAVEKLADLDPGNIVGPTDDNMSSFVRYKDSLLVIAEAGNNAYLFAIERVPEPNAFCGVTFAGLFGAYRIRRRGESVSMQFGRESASNLAK